MRRPETLRTACNLGRMGNGTAGVTHISARLLRAGSREFARVNLNQKGFLVAVERRKP